MNFAKVEEPDLPGVLCRGMIDQVDQLVVADPAVGMEAQGVDAALDGHGVDGRFHVANRARTGRFGEVLAIVVLHRKTGASFTEHDMELGKLFASLSGEVILAKNAAAKFKTIVDTSNDAIVGADADMNIILFNSAAEDMFGFSAEEALGQPMLSLL